MTERGSSPSSFGPVVLLGLVSAGLAAVASAKPWLDAGSSDGSTDATMTAVDTGTRYPLASAISLVLLAAWGVLLVTRGRFRRVVSVVGAVTALGVLATVVVGVHSAPAGVRAAYGDLGVHDVDVTRTAWLWLAALAALVAAHDGRRAPRPVRLPPVGGVMRGFAEGRTVPGTTAQTGGRSFEEWLAAQPRPLPRRMHTPT